MKDFYKLLNISEDASIYDIKKAYLKILKHSYDDEEEVYADLYRDAFRTLSNYDDRQIYDLKLFKDNIYDLVYIGDIFTYKLTKNGIHKYKLNMKDAILLKIKSNKYINLSKLYSYDQIINILHILRTENTNELNKLLIYEDINPELKKYKVAKNIRSYTELMDDKDTIRKLEILRKN